MKKLSLLLYHAEKERFLSNLQELGVIQVVEKPDLVSADLEKSLELLKRSRRILHSVESLPRFRLAGAVPSEMKRVISDEGEVHALLESFDGLNTRISKLRQEIEYLVRERELLAPWGDFDPENLKRLEGVGIRIRFFRSLKQVDRTGFLSTGDNGRVPGTENVYFCVISEDDDAYYFTVFERGESSVIQADEIQLPAIFTENLHDEIREREQEMAYLKEKRDEYTSHHRTIKEFELLQANRVRFIEADLHMLDHAEGSVYSMEGWFQAKDEKRIREFLDGHTGYYEFSNPRPDEDVPVVLQNGLFARMFEPITRIFSLPSYYELDPTPFFAPFFALFFGLCLADFGYGVIMILLSVTLSLIGPKSFRPIFRLGIVLSAVTIAAGIFLNTAFGYPIYVMPGSKEGLFTTGEELAFLSNYDVEGQTVFPAMYFALMLGFIQVIFGIILQGINSIRKSGILFGLQPLSYLLMIAGGLIWYANDDREGLGSLKIGPFPIGVFLTAASGDAGTGLLSAGVALLVLFNNPDKRFFIRPPLALWELYGFATGLMGDILSYLRLFALGLAGGLLGNAFNQIALMFITDESGTVHYASFGAIGTLLVLLLGHTLNLGLAILGGFVHSLRLTFVEFYKNMKFVGGGKTFRPFSLKKLD